jgi:hypothetical protein
MGMTWMACASVPKESVELSMVVGERITDMQVAHEAIVQEYFHLSRMRVEDFLRDRWVPQFLENFVRDAQIITLLDEPGALTDQDLARIREELDRTLRLSEADQDRVVAAVHRAIGDAERGALMIEFAQAAVAAIETQRAQLIGPINAQERSVLNDLRASYSELRATQDAITNFLRSVKDVTVEQDAILQRLGLLEARDHAIESAIDLNDQIVEILGHSTDAEATVNQILELVDRANSN